jgi:preprotein translocase subunit SecG
LFGSKFAKAAIALFLIAMLSMGFMSSKDKSSAVLQSQQTSQE